MLYILLQILLGKYKLYLTLKKLRKIQDDSLINITFH